MPAMADLTVKKADDVTNITYSSFQPSSGDGVAAVWRSETVGSAAAHKPTLTMTSRWNGPKTARRVEISYAYPQIYTDTNTGLVMVQNRIPFTLSGVIPVAVPDSDINEAVAQLTNLLDAALVNSCLKAGVAPT